MTCNINHYENFTPTSQTIENKHLENRTFSFQKTVNYLSKKREQFPQYSAFLTDMIEECNEQVHYYNGGKAILERPLAKSDQILDINSYEEFTDRLKWETEGSIVAFVQTHRLNFLQSTEAIKFKKRKEEGVDEMSRSKILAHSLVILPNKTIFRTTKIKNKSLPEGKLLGRGSWKMAFKVFDLNTQGYVAITQSNDSSLREYEITQRIDSPFILKVECAATRSRQDHKETIFYTVAPLCQSTLLDELKKNPQYLQFHPEYLTQIKMATEACHEAGFVHRDITVRNIFIKDGNALLADFGNAIEIDKNRYMSDIISDNKSITSIEKTNWHHLY